MSAQALTAGTAAEMGSDPNLSPLEYHMTEFITMGYVLRPKTIEISYLFCFPMGSVVVIWPRPLPAVFSARSCGIEVMPWL